jgi:hypothetical protein
METLIAVCGDICTECPRYLATKSGNIEELEKVAQFWFRLGFRDHVVTTEEIKCTGCHKKPNCGYGLTSCEYLVGKANCGECERFPCPKFDEVFRKSEIGDESCKLHCSTDEYRVLKKAFFSKKKVLTEIHREKFQ